MEVAPGRGVLWGAVPGIFGTIEKLESEGRGMSNGDIICPVV